MSEFIVVVDNSIPFVRGVLDRYASVFYFSSEEITQENLQKTGAKALIVRSVTQCNEALLEGTDVLFIATATAGFDHIDQNYCASHHIQWCNAEGCNAGGVAHWVMTALSHNALRKNRSMNKEVLGLVGVGNVGKQVELLAKKIGIETYLCDPFRADREGREAFVSLEEIAEKCTVISLHTPLTKEGAYPTYHLIGDSFLEKCKKKPTLLNASRGGVVVTNSLIEGVEKGILDALYIDCWEGEPVINKKLLAHSVFATPHIAGFSAEGKARGARMAVAAVLDFFGIENFNLEDIKAPNLEVGRELLLSASEFYLEELYLSTASVIQGGEKALREAPELFETHRKKYPFHRESSAYFVSVKEAEKKDLLEDLAFVCS